MKNYAENGLIEAEELAEILKDPVLAGQTRLVDASYALSGPSPRAGYETRRIGKAVFFDVDEVADQSTDLPHMLPAPAEFERAVEQMGISSEDLVVVYGQTGIAMAACRVWWMFRAFGHENICILNGGLPAWEKAGLTVTTGTPPHATPGRFKSRFTPALVKSRAAELATAMQKPGVCVLDARSAERFAGTAPEPRPGLASGHIPGSVNIPFPSLLDPATGKMKSSAELRPLFGDAERADEVIVTCGSGITACVLAFGFYRINKRLATLYDGSWADWGRKENSMPIATRT